MSESDNERETLMNVKFKTSQGALVQIEQLSAKDKEKLVQLKKLWDQRDTILNKLHKVQIANEAFILEQLDLYTFQAKCSLLSRIKTQFVEVQAQIYENSLTDEEEEEENEVIFLSLYNKLSWESKLLMEKPKVGSNEVIDTKYTPAVRLPKLEIPEFHGEYTNWKTFKDTFQSVVHNNKSVADVNKFHFLLNALKGNTNQVIMEIPVTEENYPLAWQRLLERYDNPRSIVDSHLQKLFSIRPIIKESAVELRNLVDTVQINLRALKTQQQPVEEWSTILVYFISQWLDAESRKQWELQLESKEIPKYDVLMEFLLKRCRMLEAIHTGISAGSATSAAAVSYKQATVKGGNKFTTKSFSTNIGECPQCQENHAIYQCPEFSLLTPHERKNKVFEWKRCFKCLGPHIQNCSSKGACKICKDPRHNTMLHFGAPADTQIINAVEEENSIKGRFVDNNVNLHCNEIALGKKVQQILMSTAVICIMDAFGNWHQARALMDSASQSSFMTDSLVQLLQLKRHRVNIPVTGINQASTTIKYKTTVRFKSRLNNYQTGGEFLVVPRITNDMPSSFIDISTWKLPDSIFLADPRFWEPGKVDVLLGTQYFYELLMCGRLSLGIDRPGLFESQIGWLVAGVTWSVPSAETQCFFSSEKENVKTEEQILCEEHFKATCKRAADGRFVLKLPFKGNVELGESRTVALKRFHYLQQKLDKNLEFKKEYEQFMETYLASGHMEIAANLANSSKCYYIPHHAVYKPESTTTKLRVVFDGSAKTSTGSSLNDVLRIGPTVQRPLLFVILRFVKHMFVFMADIEKMYRQVWIAEEDRDYLRIFWKTREQLVQEYRLCTVTYGTSCAPYQATKVLNQLAIEEQHRYPEGSKLITDFYMDDVLTGNNDLVELKRSQQQLVSMLQGAGMKLRKFASNSSELLENIPQSDIEGLIDINDHASTVKTLGLVWDPKNDKFMFKIPKLKEPIYWTKRLILSELFRFFDPAGWMGPVKLLGNQLIQQLWISQVSWDEPIPNELLLRWLQLHRELPLLNSVEKDRLVFKSNHRIQLHGFCDASLKSYGAVIYIRSEDECGNINVELLCSQSRVAAQPNKKRKKPITLPRLELCAAHLLAILVNRVIKELQLESVPVCLYGDSQIVLCWLKKAHESFVSYISRRIKDIQQHTNLKCWNYVESSKNPADIISRGLMPSQLINNQLWWHGPEFLHQNPIEHAQISTLVEVGASEEMIACMLTEDSDPLINVQNYSSYSKLVRVTAWILRFINNCRKQSTKGKLSWIEIGIAEKLLVKQIQYKYFQPEIQELSHKRPINNKSKLLPLNPMLVDGLLRVGGRLHNSLLSENTKHPMIIPGNHHFTHLLIEHEHQRNFHGGTQLVLGAIRQKFWPLQGKSNVKLVIRKCIRCFRVKPRFIDQLMGTLPSARVQPSRPFTVTGLDYCGPFFVHNKTNRPTALVKIWVCIFVCYATKAVHLEPVTDLTTGAFLKCIRRFRARRGQCVILNSDNQTTFHGAKGEIAEMYAFFRNQSINEEIKELCSVDGMEWKFIPAKSPHVGGLWESAVKSFKHHLKRVTIGSHNFTFEEFLTLVCEIEACLNSRPLTPLTEDPDDIAALTPGHFLIGEPLNAFVEPNIQDIAYNRLRRYQRIQKTTQAFWKVWQREYLNTLQQRYKWKVLKDNLKIGDLVLLIEENLPPTKWLMGRVVGVSKGQDQQVRMVDIKLSHRTTRRAIQKVCPLPINQKKGESLVNDRPTLWLCYGCLSEFKVI